LEAVCRDSPKIVKIENCADTGRICKNGSCVLADLIAPTIINTAPMGVVYNQNVTLVVNTNEAADCRFDKNDVEYKLMAFQFSTPNKIYHMAIATLNGYGDYNYYVRCQDVAGNYTTQSAKISFTYKETKTGSQRKEEIANDHQAPVISGLSPFGDLENTQVEISCATNEEAVCKYDTIDTDYNLMRYQLDSQNEGTTHSKDIKLEEEGTYIYYFRCQDIAGNTNKRAAKIIFNFLPVKDNSPRISGLLPSGTIYQPDVALSLITDRPAECRWDANNIGFDEMTKVFLTADSQTQYATLRLNDFGEYSYYVRCKDKQGNLNKYPAQIFFVYENPEKSKIEEKIIALNQFYQKKMANVIII